MNIKNEKQIKNMISKMLRIVNKLSRVEKQPIVLDNGQVLSTKEIHTIQVVGENKIINVTEVGAHFGVTKGAASQMISRLVSKGFIAKVVSSHSNKEYELSLTGKGKIAFDAHERYHGKELRELIKHLKQFELDQLMISEQVFDALEITIDKRLE